MKIGLISDTHGSKEGIMNALKALGDVDLLLHAGDYAFDARYIEEELHLNIQYVKGNTDYGLNYPTEKMLEYEGERIFLTHGHDYGVKRSLNRLFFRASELGATVCVFGHTHIPLTTKEGDCLFVNPGSPSHPRLGIPTCAILEIGQTIEPKAQIIELL